MMQNSGTSGFSLSAIAIRRHIGTLMLTLTMVVLGIFFLTQLQVDLLPSITYPRIGVRINAPGVSPEVAVDEITRPLEEALTATEGVVQVYSQTREGQVSLDLFFQPGGDIDQALNDATAAFNRARGQLPDIIEEPRLFKIDPSQSPVYELALQSSSLRDVDLRVFADEELSRELSIVPGVAAVDVAGGVEEEVRVQVDLRRLQAQGITLKDVLDALSNRNQDVSGGRLQGNESEPLTRTVGRFKNAQEIRNLSLEVRGATTPGSPVRRINLGEVAQVIDGTEEQRVFVFLNGQSAVKLSVQKQQDANTVSVVEGVKKRLEELRKSGLIPQDMVMIPTLDESRFIRNSLNDVTSNAVSGALLAAVAVLFFLGSLRQTFIISLTIPLCTLTALILMKFFGFSLNIFSLAGLTLGIGQAIDTSVVIMENIAEGTGMTPGSYRKRQNVGAGLTDSVSGKQISSLNPPSLKEIIEQSISSGQEVESAMIASTGANLVSVLPFVLIGGFFSLLFNELILTICFAVAASLLVALTIVPMLTSRLLAIPWSSRVGQFWVVRIFNQMFEAATGSYSRTLARILRYRFFAIAIAFLLLGGGSLWMALKIPQEILPRINTGQASLNAQFPPGTSLETNLKVMRIVDKILQEQPETDSVFTTVGGFIFSNATTANPLRSSSTITLKQDQVQNMDAFVERVSHKFEELNLAGITLRLNPSQVRGIILTNSPVRGADLEVILQGQDEQKLQQAGRQVLAALEEGVKAARFRRDGDPRQPEVQIRPDWDRLAELGLSAKDIGDTVQTAIEGSVPTQLQRGERLIDVRVQLAKESRVRASQLVQLPVFASNNRQIFLGDVATLAEGQAPGDVQRINQRQVFMIAGNLRSQKKANFLEFLRQLIEDPNQNNRASLSDAFKQVENVLSNLKLPEGVTVMPSSAKQTNQQLQDSLKLLGGLSAFLVFVVMAVQYNSVIDPLVIILTVPLALAGGILGLFVTQTAIGATVLVGAVLLVGIVVNIAIIMIETANQILEQEGVDRETAMLKAAPQRLRPIMMTTITTVIGLFPLALGIGEGSEFLQPLGIVVFFGMSISTLLTLFIIPCFYTLLHDFPGSKPRKKVKRERQKIKEKETVVP